MTTTVSVTAHCAKNKEVSIKRVDYDGNMKEIFIQDGESYTNIVYDACEITVREVLKQNT